MVPVTQSMQTDAWMLPVPLMPYMPAAQSMQSDAASLPYVPAGQGSQEVAPADAAVVPAAQTSHAVDGSESPSAVPATHSTHSVLPYVDGREGAYRAVKS